ncbi:Rha family transcriptional regulator [Anaerosacchariphilus polymeriproducens]|uniref:Rha family transcriptional regulator n=1 Tax=Anaerosacchariphilus polymeriproducens TaxID=1812858 RepID=A0A371AYY6_9FIRM|nr:Rha family transcriptional regulator [Anaerosacchariphilus polymeriproducens]RDU24763.1 Rha family transcriptional regulator [Anaerosacchariphilus polymeriproducens]
MKQLEQTITSLEVAEMMETRHQKILEKLDGSKDGKTKGIITILTEHDFVLSEYFQESTYKDISGKTNKCYKVTKLGCDFLANKFTGEKGILFTAKYVKRFHEMEEIITQPTCMEDILIFNLQEMKAVKEKMNEQDQKLKCIGTKVDGIKDIVALNPTDWRKETTDLINRMAHNLGGYEHIRAIREESYKLLEQRYGVALSIRLTNKKRRMAEEGICKSKRDKLSNLDVIAEDKKLVEGYTAIIKEMAIKYGVA